MQMASGTIIGGGRFSSEVAVAIIIASSQGQDQGSSGAKVNITSIGVQAVQAQGDNKIQNQDEDQYEDQKEEGERIFNPCKCCYNGNLRQACFLVGLLELVYCIWCIVWSVLGGIMVSVEGTTVEDSNKHTRGGKQTFRNGSSSTSAIIPVACACWVIFLILLIPPPLFMLISVKTKKKMACLLHTIFASIAGFMHLVGFIGLVIGMTVMQNQVDECKLRGEPDSEFEESRCGFSEMIFLIPFAVISIQGLVFACLFVYFAVDSVALCKHYQGGLFYENTDLSCLGGSGRRGKPQYENETTDQSVTTIAPSNTTNVE